MSSRDVIVSLASSGTALEKEYRLVDWALARFELREERFDAKAYDPRAINAARESWALRMGAEHRSTLVFSQLAAQLFEANATIDAKVVMLRMAQDELRHTETCGEVTRALGGDGTCRFHARVERMATHAVFAEEVALRNVVFTTCMSEMVAVARLVDEHDSTRDPYLREATRRLLADEILHAQFGFHYLEAWRGWLEDNKDVMRSLDRYFCFAFAVLERELATSLPSALSASSPLRLLSDDERALGLSSPERAREIFYETVEHAIVPGLCRFGLDAESAWKDRALV